MNPYLGPLEDTPGEHTSLYLYGAMILLLVGLWLRRRVGEFLMDQEAFLAFEQGTLWGWLGVHVMSPIARTALGKNSRGQNREG